jgi:tetratricopeptide (TPR) repeat protein
MSLLLDALKKAADEKQKAAQDGPTESISTSEAAEPVADEKEAELRLQASDNERRSSGEAEELTLDVLDGEVLESDDSAAAVKEFEAAKESTDDDLQLVKEKSLDPPEQKSYTVSDEALSMLIYKTNRDVKHGKRLVIFGVLLVSVVILASGAAYYYMDMQSEIANLERKHQIAMQSMQSKTSREKAPAQSEIIRNLVSEAPFEEKVQYAKKRISDVPVRAKNSQKSPVVASGKAGNEAGTVSFQKTNKADPIAAKLDQAWQAYDDGRYSDAKKLYGEVLKKEGSNRDALLGLGAMAVIEKNYPAARDIYMSLLRQDPRDPIAIAAIASLKSDPVSLQADEAFLQNMLSKNPDAAHLNFALGNVYAQQQKWKSAQQSYFNAWQQDIENADYIFNLAVSLDQLGKPEQAANFYSESLSKSKNKQVSFSREAVQKRITELSGS